MPDQTDTLTTTQTADTQHGRSLKVLLAGPRGFCAGVDRAIRVVEEAIRRYGAPVYVRHEIVHNRTVVEELEAQGAIFVEELDEVPADGHVVFPPMACPRPCRPKPSAATFCIWMPHARWCPRSTARPSAIMPQVARKAAISS